MEIRAFELEKDLEGVLQLLSISLKNPKGEEWFRWKHLDNPFGKSRGYVAIDKERVAGIRLFMNWKLTYEGKAVKALRPVDTATHPEHRLKGVFKQLTAFGLSDANADDSHAIFNTPNNNSLPGLLKMGWQQLHKPIPHSYFLINHYRISLQVRQHNNFDSFLFAPAGNHKLVETDKTEEFYKWRYKDKKYEIVSLVDDNSTFIVYQMLKVKGVKIIAVADFYGHLDVFPILLRSLAKKMNVFICHCTEYPTVFSTAGITKINRGSSFVVYKGPEAFREVPWKFSPGDLEAII
ncbi:GNAT family N-acetyltransferase [Pontibacter pamirensis]|uniref:GNAT family N-acetyltransferase n=1 Tax=Pontibacter pamirensis TaxID=2562824 RepID=UPI001389D090|nr:GNAT family N-acetyltransferase [Pontibacter pamirensis]